MATKKRHKNKVRNWLYRIIRWYVAAIYMENSNSIPVIRCLEILVDHYGLDINPEKQNIEKIIALLEVRNAPQFNRGKIVNKPMQVVRQNEINAAKQKLQVKSVIRETPKKKSIIADGKFYKFYKSWEWKKARYEALKRHGAKCQCCGATKADAKIVVDHIKPIRFHWELRLDQSNLQILCDDCNKGKSFHDTTDWRGSE